MADASDSPGSSSGQLVTLGTGGIQVLTFFCSRQVCVAARVGPRQRRNSGISSSAQARVQPWIRLLILG
jgi:hypothetical protein